MNENEIEAEIWTRVGATTFCQLGILPTAIWPSAVLSIKLMNIVL